MLARAAIQTKVACCRPLTIPSKYEVAKPKQKYKLLEAIEIIKEKVDVANAAYELDINLNIDPRMEGHELKGVFDLPHGAGNKAITVVALTTDEDLAISALQVGARFAGDLGDALTHHVIKHSDIHRVVCTTEMENIVRKPPRRGAASRLVRILKNLKMTPCLEDRTLVEPEEFVEVVKHHANGTYRRFVASKQGCVATSLGRVELHTPEQIVENMNAVLRHLYAIQPEDFGTGPIAKNKNAGKYILGIHMGNPQSGSFPLYLPDVLSEVDDISLYLG